MNRLIKNVISSIVLAVLLFSVPASAVSTDESIKTKNLIVKTDRLFEVEVGLNSSRIITAARFKLNYNKNDIAVRQLVSNTSGAKVRYNDTNGLTDVIFLCSDGVKCSDYPALFSVKYKKLNDKNTKVSIEALDCVDNNVKNFAPPKSAVCKIKGVSGSSLSSSSSAKSRNKSSSKGGSRSTKSSKSSGKSNNYSNDNNDNNDNDILDTSGKSYSAVAQDEEDVKFEDENEPFYLKFLPIIILVILCAFFGVILYQNVQLKKAEKRRQEENEITDNKEE